MSWRNHLDFLVGGPPACDGSLEVWTWPLSSGLAFLLFPVVILISPSCAAGALPLCLVKTEQDNDSCVRSKH